MCRRLPEMPARRHDDLHNVLQAEGSDIARLWCRGSYGEGAVQCSPVLSPQLPCLTSGVQSSTVTVIPVTVIPVIPNGNRLLTKLDYLESGAFRARVLACGQPVM